LSAIKSITKTICVGSLFHVKILENSGVYKNEFLDTRLLENKIADWVENKVTLSQHSAIINLITFETLDTIHNRTIES